MVPECSAVPNYNMATSVHHPHFLAEYVARVVPLYGGNERSRRDAGEKKRKGGGKKEEGRKGREIL